MAEKRTFTIRMSEELYQLVKVWAEERHYSVNAAANIAFEDLLVRYNLMKPKPLTKVD